MNIFFSARIFQTPRFLLRNTIPIGYYPIFSSSLIDKWFTSTHYNHVLLPWLLCTYPWSVTRWMTAALGFQITHQFLTLHDMWPLRHLIKKTKRQKARTSKIIWYCDGRAVKNSWTVFWTSSAFFVCSFHEWCMLHEFLKVVFMILRFRATVVTLWHWGNS